MLVVPCGRAAPAFFDARTDEGVLSLIGPNRLISVALSDVLRAAPDSYKAKMGSSEGHMLLAAKLQRWATPVERIFDLIQAGATLIAGGRDSLTCYDATDGHKTWETEIRGDAHELLVVDDALLVSTTEGEIHCYRPGTGGLPLKVLWFGVVGPADAVSRHYRGPAPLAIDGRLYVPGNEFLHAVDAYNGRILWKRKLPGIGRWPMTTAVTLGETRDCR